MALTNREITQGRATAEFQDFFTDAKAAKVLANRALKGLRKLYLKEQRPVRILEPAVGSGNLIWPLLESDVPMQILCCDIQLDYLEYLAAEAKSRGYFVRPGKFGGVVVRNYK